MIARTLRGWRLVAVTLGLGPALAACAASMNCTAAGCGSGVSVDIASLASKGSPLSAMATLCVERACETSQVTFKTAAPDTMIIQTLPTDPKPTAGMQVPVTLTVTQGSTVLLDTNGTATLSQIAPNGTACGPICFFASLVLDGQDLKQSRRPAPAAESEWARPATAVPRASS